MTSEEERAALVLAFARVLYENGQAREIETSKMIGDELCRGIKDADSVSSFGYDSVTMPLQNC